MANFDQLKQSVAALIKTNGAEEITGQIMQDVLLTIINSISGGYMFGGVAQHNGNVGNPDYNVFYLAGSGAYTGYGGAITIENGCYGVFRYNGSWTQEVVDIGVRLSGSIVEGETRGVTGDVINTALQTLFDNVMDILDTLTFTYNTPSAQQATKAMLDVIMTPTGGAPHVFATLTLASATVAAAGLMSAEDKQKVDRMLTDFRSLSFSDTTAAADQATKIVQTLSATLGENPEAITTMTFLAATASKAGLMSAADKAVLDCLVAMLGYYECSTAAGTAAKVVSASGYSLTSGGCIRIKMTNANTANNVTLNINSTGAKALYYDGAQASSTNTWGAGEVLEVYYDGTQYQCASGGGNVPLTSINVSVLTHSNYQDIASALAAVPSSYKNDSVSTIIFSDGATLHKYKRYVSAWADNASQWYAENQTIQNVETTYSIPKSNNEKTTVFIPFEVGKTYRIEMSVSSVTNSTKYMFLYRVAGSNVDKFTIGNIPANQTSAIFNYTPVEGQNYQNAGVYATSAYNSPITFKVSEALVSEYLLDSDIVNDLTTGGADKVLSAEQGKVLYQNSYSEPVELTPTRTSTGKGMNAKTSSPKFGQEVTVAWLQTFYFNTIGIDKVLVTVPVATNDGSSDYGTVLFSGGSPTSAYVIPNVGTNGYVTIAIDTSNADSIATTFWYNSEMASNFSCKSIRNSAINEKILELEGKTNAAIPEKIDGKDVVIITNSNISEELAAGGKYFIINSDVAATSAVTIGADSVLDFRGGTLAGTYTGNQTKIIANPVRIFGNVNLSGTWQAAAYYCEWFNSTDISINAESCIAAFGAIKFVGHYEFTQNIDIKRIASVEFASGSYLKLADTFVHPYLFEVYFPSGYFPSQYRPFWFDSVKFFGEGLVDMNGRAGFLRTESSNKFNCNLTNLRVINFGVCTENAATSLAYVELRNQENYIVNCSFSYKEMTEVPHQQYGLLFTHYDNKVVRTTIISHNIGIRCKGGTYTDVHVWGWPAIGINSYDSYLKMTNCYLDCCAESIRLDAAYAFMITNLQVIGTSHRECSDGHRYIMVTPVQNVKGILTCQVSYEPNTEQYKPFAVLSGSTYSEYTPSSSNIDYKIL